MILTNNTLISTSKSLPAWAAVGIVPGAAHIWSAENTKRSSEKSRTQSKNSPSSGLLCTFSNYRFAFVLHKEWLWTVVWPCKFSHTFLYFLFSWPDPLCRSWHEEASAGIQMYGNGVTFRPHPSKFLQCLLENTTTRQPLPRLTSNSFLFLTFKSDWDVIEDQCWTKGSALMLWCFQKSDAPV